MSDDEENESKSIRPPTYPYELVDENGMKVNITGTICIKFLNMKIKINGEDSPVQDPSIRETEMNIDCRISVYSTDKDKFIVEIMDDVYHPRRLFIPVVNNKYTYTVFADAVWYCKKLGYIELFNKSRFDEVMDKDTKLKQIKFDKWWLANKRK